MPRTLSAIAPPVEQRLRDYDWPQLESDLDAHGWAHLPRLLTPDDCVAIAGLYGEASRFRSRIVMARHGFGRGEYQYFSYPLPEPIATLRGALYGRLAGLANRWHEAMAIAARFPAAHADFIARCHEAGQTRPTPLILRYEAGGWNALHQDLYGELVFPLQVVVGLDRPGVDYTGGEFVVVEQRPRSQSRATALTVEQGHGFVFTTRDRPVRSSRGWSTNPMRHGASLVRSGRRHTLGIIFHDAA